LVASRKVGRKLLRTWAEMLQRIREMGPLNNELVVAAKRLLSTADEEEAIRLIPVRQNNPRVSASEPRRSLDR
jgi:hypothetical protein